MTPLHSQADLPHGPWLARLGGVDHLTGLTVRLLMRRHGRAIGELARAVDVTQVRVREVREHGVDQPALTLDWVEAITGVSAFDWHQVADLYLGRWRRDLPPIRGKSTNDKVPVHEQ